MCFIIANDGSPFTIDVSLILDDDNSNDSTVLSDEMHA